MKGFIGRIIIIFCILLTISGVFLLLNRPTGVGVDCNGEITSLGNPSFPLQSFETGCRAEVEASLGNKTVCTGSGQVRGESSIITCNGLENYEGEELMIEAKFYNDTGNYANASGTFYNGK